MALILSQIQSALKRVVKDLIAEIQSIQLDPMVYGIFLFSVAKNMVISLSFLLSLFAIFYPLCIFNVLCSIEDKWKSNEEGVRI